MPTFDALEHQRAALPADVGRWPAGAVTYRMAPGAWTAAQVLDHFARSERGILAQVRQRLDAPHRRGLRDRLGCAFLERVFRSERRVRVPASVAALVAPAAGADLAAVHADWDATRADLARLLITIGPAQGSGGVFRHPVAGWMGVREVLRFFWVHAHHHAFQLARVRAAAEEAGRRP